MKNHVAVQSAAGFAVFDAKNRLLAAHGPWLENTKHEKEGATAATVLGEAIARMAQVDGQPVKATKAFAKRAIDRWRDSGPEALDARDHDGRRYLLTAHPNPDGGTAYISTEVPPDPDADRQDEDTEVFRCITDSHPLPVWMADEETGEILYESIKASELLGRPWDPDKPQFITDHYVDPKDRETVKAALAGDTDLHDFDVAFRSADGHRFWISANVRRCQFKGRTALIAGIVDITARKEREDQLRYLMESHPMPVWANDAETGEVLYTSEAANRLFGADGDNDAQIPGHIGDFFVDKSDAATILEDLRVTGQANNIEVRAKTIDGRPLWVNGAAKLVQYDGREIVLAGIMDVTSRRQREEQIRFLLEAHPLPVWMNDAETGEVLFESPETARMFGRTWSRDTKISVHDHYADPNDRDALIEKLKREGTVDGFECIWRRADGEEFWARGNVRLMDYAGRKVVVAGIMNVTEQKRRELELTQARELLEDAIESLSEGFALYDANSELITCNSKYREMNPATAYMIEPGMKWQDMLRTAAKLGIYDTGEGQIDEWVAENEGVERDHEMQYADNRWFAVSKSPTREGGFVVTRADITERKQAEEARRSADEVVREVVDACPAALEMQCFPGGEVLFRSRAAVELLGERTQLHDADARGGILKLFEELKRDGEIVARRIELHRGDGSPFTASVSARLTTFRGDQVVVSTIQDLSDRVAVEKERNRAATRLADAIESLSEGFALFDADERLVMCNSRYREFNDRIEDLIETGARFEDLLRASVQRGQYVDAIGREEEWLSTRIPGRVEKARTREFEDTDGRWFSVVRSPTQEGGFVVTRTDITERKAMERSEREADALVRQVLEACPVMILMNHADDGRIIYHSPATNSLFGEPDNVHSFYADPSDRGRYMAMMKRDGFVDDFQYDAKRPNGEIFRASVSGRLIEYQGEQVIVSHTTDLSDRIALEEEIERQREFLHQSEKLSALGELLAGVAHELNNPLSIVVGQSLLLKETAHDERTLERADKIGKAADRCARIVKTFLAMARQQPMQTENVAVNDVLEASLELVGYSLRSSDIRVAVRLGENLPPVWADSDQLAQVFTNILVNAENALCDHDGKRRIKIVSRHDHRSGCVVIKIEDSGPGIPKEIRSRIFEPFFTTKDVGSGTGIGLALCHRIIETHGGTITIRSKPGVQTAFFIRLPASYRDEGPVSAALPELARGDGEAILVIDDEQDVSDVIAEILRREGYLVAIARSGSEALRKIERRRFKLILSDLNMPQLDGERLYEIISSDHPDLIGSLAFVTGDTMSPKAHAFLERSGRPYLEKPVRPDEVRTLARDMLGQA